MRRKAFVPFTTPQKSTSMTRSICSNVISFDVAGERDAGVVDHDVDHAEFLDDRVGVSEHRGAGR